MELETRILLSKRHNLEDSEVDEVMEDFFPVAMKYLGWKDERRDKRFIVKFHSIDWDYYEPDLFSDFCDMTYDWVKEEMSNRNLFEKDVLAGNCGHYQQFILRDITEITKDTLADVLYIMFTDGTYPKKLEEHIQTVNILWDLEQGYVDWWLEYVKENKGEVWMNKRKKS